MSDAVFRIREPLRDLPKESLASRIGAVGASVYALIREWQRRARSRWELASYSRDERKDLNFYAEVDAEIAKPFWRK